MGLLDSITGAIDNIGIGDIFRGAGAIYGAYQNSQYNDAIANAMRQQEQQAQMYYNGNRDAYQDWVAGKQAFDAANSAASSRASAAAAAQRKAYLNAMTTAKMKEEKNRQGALKKGLKYFNDQADQGIALQRPFYDAGAQLLPFRNALYTQGGNALATALQSLNQNRSMMNAAMLPSQVPAADVNRFAVKIG